MAESTSSRAGVSSGSMVKPVALVLVHELPGRPDLEAVLVDDEPVGMEAIEDREVARGEEAVDGKAASIRGVRTRVGDVRRRRGADIDGAVTAAPVAGLA